VTNPLSPAEAYEQFFVPGMFRPLAVRLLDRAAVRTGESLLDLACGTGIVARLAAPALGKDGDVVALDLRPGMIDAGRALPPPEGAAIEWLVGDATAMELADKRFDLVVCQQGLQFFADRGAALAEVRRVLSPGGRVVLAVWKSLNQQSLFAEMAKHEIAHLARHGIDGSDIELPFSLGDREEIARLLIDAGFRGVELEDAVIETAFEAEDFVRRVEYAYSAVVPDFVADPARFEDFVGGVESDTSAAVEKYALEGLVRFPLATTIALARAP
jgi:ubiquinone/menaquinone biosynthesis C-methylase UbiE